MIMLVLFVGEMQLWFFHTKIKVCTTGKQLSPKIVNTAILDCADASVGCRYAVRNHVKYVIYNGDIIICN